MLVLWKTQVGTNGIFSFGVDFRQDLPTQFPSNNVVVYYSYLIAPFWSNIDTRLDGQVNYEVYVAGESSLSDNYLGQVSSLINSEQDPSFVGNWMVVATWDGVHPFPHGDSIEQDREDPYLQSVCKSFSYCYIATVKCKIHVKHFIITYTYLGKHLSRHDHHQWHKVLFCVHVRV